MIATYIFAIRFKAKKGTAFIISAFGGILSYFFSESMINEISYCEIEEKKVGEKESKGSIKLGDKGKIIENFQNSAELIMGTKTRYFKNKGMYDKRTKKFVISVFEGSEDLINKETGQIRIDAINNFITIANNLMKESKIN
jgi:hypothetical protein